MSIDSLIEALKARREEAGNVGVLLYNGEAEAFNGVASVELSESEENVVISVNTAEEVAEEDV